MCAGLAIVAACFIAFVLVKRRRTAAAGAPPPVARQQPPKQPSRSAHSAGSLDLKPDDDDLLAGGPLGAGAAAGVGAAAGALRGGAVPEVRVDVQASHPVPADEEEDEGPMPVGITADEAEVFHVSGCSCAAPGGSLWVR